MIDDKIARAKLLIAEREKLDQELSALFGLAEQPKRGRPRKDDRPATGEDSGATEPSGDGHDGAAT